MLNDDDKAWLREAYPRLSPASDEISGVVDFTGTYNGENDHFQVLYDDSDDEVGGLRLKGNFAIRLKPRTETSLSKLPALYVLDVKPIDDRHFSRVDQSACLCSPFEEEEFLIGGLAFIPFFEQLIIPFLYGQVFFSQYRRWPWGEYAHGAVGLLEGYAEIRDPLRAEECWNKLKLDAKAWPDISSLLQQLSEISEGMQCFCQRKDQMRRCHPKALDGLRQLRRHLNAQRQSFARLIGAAPPQRELRKPYSEIDERTTREQRILDA